MNRAIICIFLSLFLLSACATTPTSTQKEKAEETRKEIVHTEQEIRSYEIFTQVLDLLQSTNDRQSVLPQVEQLYERIIREYPDAPLAQESYWKLITIYVEDHTPPAFEKAGMLYQEFSVKYPRSFLMALVEETLAKGYYRNSEWDKLLLLSAPAYKEYIEKGKRPSASLIYMYSEANYNLGRLTEAEKSYQITADLFPKLNEGMKSKEMLEKIGKDKK